MKRLSALDASFLRVETPNARDIRDRSFCLYLNENYGLHEASDCVAALIKVENHFGRA